MPEASVRDTILVPYNDADAVAQAITRNPDQVAAVIIEPIAGNMGCIPPREGYLEALRDITQKTGVVLIFDEVMTGFRVAAGGAQERFGVTPDLCCLGKIVGGGMPVGAYGGRRDIMEKIAPLGPVYQAGTLSGNPLAVAAGITTLQLIQRESPYEQLETHDPKARRRARRACGHTRNRVERSPGGLDVRRVLSGRRGVELRGCQA